MAETVLVTGGTGYLGGWCIVDALRRGYAVRTTVRNAAKADTICATIASAGVDASALQVVAADLSRDDGWDAAMAGERFVASGRFLWMREIAEAMRTGLGADGAKVPKRRLADWIIRLGGLANPQLKVMAKLLGREIRYSAAKAERVLGWKTPHEEYTVVECARSLL